MKILIMTNNDIGLYKFRKELLEKLLSHGNTVYVSVPRGDYFDKIIHIGCNIIDTEFERHGMNLFSELKLLACYIKKIKEIDADIVLTYTIKPNIYGGIACRILRKPYIVNVTGLGTMFQKEGISKKIFKKLYGVSLKYAAKVFFQNKENQDALIQYERKNNYVTIPGSGVNLEEYTYFDYPKEGEIKFLFIGRVTRDKGIDEYIEVAKRITKMYEHVSFDIAGAIDEDIYKIILEENKDTVNYLGFKDDIKDLIKEYHAVVLPSYHEGMSNVLLESAAIGRPVIASNISGCKETFDHLETGIGVKPRDIDELENAIKMFIKLPYDKKRQMGILGRKKIEESFSRKIIVEQYLKVISEIGEKSERYV